MKKFKCLLMTLLVLCTAFGAKAANGWPSNYQGVMLQGFYWDADQDAKWTTLTANVDEYSKYFKLIWVPNCSKPASGGYSMGYDPVYWFTNHTCRFGNESQLRAMIAAYKAKGTGIIEDVVINHRSGVSNWTDFPAETWNGTSWYIGTDGICQDDEVNSASGQPHCTGAYDTGEHFDGARDLDHTNANVQNNCKNFCKFLLTDLGFAGFRLDMVKGYGGQYTKIYNQYSNPTYCVGEYWDGSYDAVTGWINATGQTSAAFDFPLKYCMNDAWSNNDFTKLSWKYGSSDQPAGLIHYPDYKRLSVTFVDNHDTYRDGSKFNGDVIAANAFILMSPGTPCVFLRHYLDNKAAIQRLIDIRNAVGLTNESAVQMLQLSKGCYMAEVTGTKGKVVVKIGPDMVSPSGYADSDIKASGNGYCVWTKIAVDGGSSSGDQPSTGGDLTGWEVSNTAPTDPQGFKVFFDDTANWGTVKIWAWNNAGNLTGGDWNAKPTLTEKVGNYYVYNFDEAPTGIIFTDANDNKAGGGDLAFHNYGIYNNSGATSQYLVQVATPQPPTTTTPEHLYLMGSLEQGSWTPNVGVTMTKAGDVFTATNVVLKADAGETNAFFSFVTALGTTGASTEWDAVINASDRYGATAANAPITVGTPAAMQLFAANVDASSAYSWAIAPGTYNVSADFATMQVTVTAVTPSEPETTWTLQTTPPTNVSDYKVFFDDTANWGTVKIWAWGNAGNLTGSDWNAKPTLTDKQGKYLVYTFTSEPTGLIFTDANDNKAGGGDLVFYNYGVYNNNGFTNKYYVPSQTSITDLEAGDEVAQPVYYNLQGMRIIGQPEAGTVCIRVCGSKVSKVLVR